MRIIALCLFLMGSPVLAAQTPASPDTSPASDQTGTSTIDGDVSRRTLEQLGSGVLRYLRARGKFPVLKNPLDWKAARTFYPYVGDERLFMHPGSDIPFRFNEILGGKKPAHIINPQSFAVFYEIRPSDDGRRGVLFLDGHVERVKHAHWAKIVNASKIPISDLN